MKKLLTASLCWAILTAVAGVPSAFADRLYVSPDIEIQTQVAHVPPHAMKVGPRRNDQMQRCRHPITGREGSKRECLAWTFFILLRTVAKGGDEASHRKLQLDKAPPKSPY